MTRSTAGDIRARRARPRLVELALAVSVIALLAAALLREMLWYAERAEKAAVEQVAGAISAALHFRIAELLVKNREAEIAALAEDNPMNWLERRPSTYAGAFDETPSDAQAAPGAWYFDTRTRQLVYRAVRTRYLDDPGDGVLRFKVWLDRERLPGGESLAEPIRTFRRAEFAPVTPYRWFAAN